MAGYYRYAEECAPCSSSSGDAAIMLLLAACWIAFVLLFTQLAGGAPRFQSLMMGISYLQIIAVFGFFSGLPYPSAVLNLLHGLSFFNFNIELARPECLSRSMVSPFNRLIAAVIQPFIAIVLLAAYVLVVGVIRAARNSFVSTRRTMEVSAAVASDVVAEAEMRKLAHSDSIRASDWAYLNSFAATGDRAIGALCIYFALAYIGLAKAAFSAIDCTTVSNGKMMLDSAPSVVCYSDAVYRSMVPIVVTAIIVYVIGIPAGLWLYIRRNRSHLTSPQVALRIGFLSARYHFRFAEWEVAIILRKAIIVIAATLISSHVTVAVSACLVALFVALMLQVNFFPLRDARLFRLETFLQVDMFLILFAGLSFRAHPSTGGGQAIGGIVIALVAIGIILVLAVLVDMSNLALTISRLLGRSSLKIGEVRRRLAAYFVQCASPQHAASCMQYVMRGRHDDLLLIHRMLVVMRHSSRAVAVVLQGVCPDDVVVTEKDLARSDRAASRRPASAVERLDARERKRLAEEPRWEETNGGSGPEEWVFNRQGDSLDLAALLELSSVFSVPFRMALLEWISTAKDHNVRALQQTVEILRANVLQPERGRLPSVQQ